MSKRLLFFIFLSAMLSSGQNKMQKVSDNKTYLNKIVFEDFSLKDLSTDATSVETNYFSCLAKFNYSYDSSNITKKYEGYGMEITKYHENLQKKELLQEGKQYHSLMNDILIEKFGNINFTNLYVSKYAPFFSFEISKGELIDNSILNELCKSSFIEEITVKTDYKYEEYMTSAKNLVGGTTITNDNPNLNGEGIRVGVLECGIADKNSDVLANVDITCRDEWYYIETKTEHATAMSAIIAGEDGIAKNAKLFSVELFGNPSSEIDWLLDNEVDIINCSYGDSNPTGNYLSDSAYFDYIIMNYKKTVVAAAGNNNEKHYVANPGMGYNVITVGASASTTPTLANFSSYVTNTNQSKPNLVAPGINVFVSDIGMISGTSPAAAITSGYVALLMQEYPFLKTSPHSVRALLCANATDVNNHPTTIGLEEKVGTGLLNFANAFNTYNYLRSASTGESGFVRYWNFFLKAGQKVRVCASWMVKATGKKNETTFARYRLRITDMDVMTFEMDYNQEDNIEFIEFIAPEDNVYKVMVDRPEDHKVLDTEEVSFASYIQPL